MFYADELAERARQEADKYIKTYWGSMAFDNLTFDAGLYDQWLNFHDNYIDAHTKKEN